MVCLDRFKIGYVSKLPLGAVFLVATFYTSAVVMEICSFVSLGQLFRKAVGPATLFWVIFLLLYLTEKSNIPMIDSSGHLKMPSVKSLLLHVPFAVLVGVLMLELSSLGAIYVQNTVCRG